MYIDPSSGGLILQILAVMFGLISGTVLLFAGRIRVGAAQIRRKLRQRFGREEQADSVEE